MRKIIGFYFDFCEKSHQTITNQVPEPPSKMLFLSWKTLIPSGQVRIFSNKALEGSLIFRIALLITKKIEYYFWIKQCISAIISRKENIFINSEREKKDLISMDTSLNSLIFSEFVFNSDNVWRNFLLKKISSFRSLFWRFKRLIFTLWKPSSE